MKIYIFIYKLHTIHLNVFYIFNNKEQVDKLKASRLEIVIFFLTF